MEHPGTSRLLSISRRRFLETGAAAGVAAAQTVTPQPMVAWIFVHSPLEFWLPGFKRTFDAWEAGGVRGIAIGYLRFAQPDGSTLPTFPANERIYKSYGVEPPAETARDLEKEKRLHALLDDAARRGWQILLFGTPRSGGSRPVAEDPFGAIGYAAAVQDAMNSYPQAHGVIIDGAGEHHYELAFHHGGELFELRAWERERYPALGMDLARMERGIAHLWNRFHSLTPALVRYHSPAGLVAALSLFDLNEDSLYWLRCRQEYSMRYFAAVRREIDRMNRKVLLATIPRAPAFSALTTQDYQRMHPYFDYVFPKHYFWHRGFDGMYGTVARWVQRIQEWNPGLSERDCFWVVKAWFGIELPGVDSLAAMELGFPNEFFEKIVYQETRRALEAIGDDNKVIAWISTGRGPHAGDPMPARDLHRILAASQKAGLKRFLFHPDPDLGAAEWSVISGLCGKPWNDSMSGYWPSDTPRLDSFSGGRKPGDGK